jgi:hypothetical protein
MRAVVKAVTMAVMVPTKRAVVMCKSMASNWGTKIGKKLINYFYKIL